MAGSADNTIQELLSGAYASTQQLRSDDHERIATMRAITEIAYADLVELIDGPPSEDPYILIGEDSDEPSIVAVEVYSRLHNYLASLYSFNESIRGTVSAYLPEGVELTKANFDPERVPGIEYTRRCYYLRGLRNASQHGAFTDCLNFKQWDSDSNRWRMELDEATYCNHERLDNPSEYLRSVGGNMYLQPLKFVSSFHNTNFDPFYRSCLDWFG